MEKLAAQIAEHISTSMNYDHDRQEVIAYGLIALFQMTIIASAITIIGLVGGFWYEAAIIFLGAGFLRKSTGGAHAQTLLGCTLLSILFISALSALCRYILIHALPYYAAIPVLVVLITLCLFITYRKAPVDNPNKPITRPEKIKRLRKQSIYTIIIYGLICVAFAVLSQSFSRFGSLSYALLCAIMWQTFTLTRPGETIIRILDHPFTKRN